MKLTDIQIIKKDNRYYEDLLDLMHKSKNLYNAALYTVRQYYQLFQLYIISIFNILYIFYINNK